MSMRVAFAGTPEFARVALAQLHAAGFTIPLVLTQPDRPAGRGMKLQASPVKQFAQAHGIPVAQPRSLRLDGKYPDDAAAARAALQAAQPDVLVVAAYGLILPQWVLDFMSAARPPEGAKAPSGGSETGVAVERGDHGLGCLNIHASLLPRWRGAAPIHRAIEAGDAETGVTIMQMDAGLDTGDMLLTERLPIGPRATTASLHDELAALGGRLIVEALELAACGGLTATPQPAEGITYAHKIDKQEAAIDWAQPAAVIERRIRAFDPFPGASSSLGSDVLKLWRSEVDGMPRPADAPAGQILQVDDEGVRVACGIGAEGGVLRLTELQRPGDKRLPVREFLRGIPLQPGQRLGASATVGTTA